jgi:hypothetical protein
MLVIAPDVQVLHTITRTQAASGPFFKALDSPRQMLAYQHQIG